MSVAEIAASNSCECEVCAYAPCQTPGFCKACRAAAARREPEAQNRPRSTPESTIEAIMWTVRERGPPALHEQANIERLSRCDDAALGEIDGRIKRLEGINRAS